MVFNAIQAILLPAFTIITKVLDKQIILNLKFEPKKNLKIRSNNFGAFTEEAL